MEKAVRSFSIRIVIILSLLLVSVLFAGCSNFTGSSKPFTIIALPDTQVYSIKFPEVFYQQTEWVAKNISKLNCKFVIHEGDIVEKGRDENLWLVADKAMSKLDGKVPYCFTPGNHDGPFVLFNKYFPFSRYDYQPWYGGCYELRNENSYHFFSASGLDFMIVCLRFDPNESVLAWANEVVEKHPDRRVIVATHSYIDRSKFTPEGEKIWNGFVRKHKNIFLVFCGHLSVGQRTDTGDNGNTVHSLLADYQGLDFGGQGWLRIMKFIPRKNKIEVCAYSTRLKKIMGPGDDKYSKPPMNNFYLDYDMTGKN